jgi:hypothetical protein
MLKTKICGECKDRLEDAFSSIHLHRKALESAIDDNLSGKMTEEDRQYLAPELAQSFDEAQAAWDAYRDHLVGHGLLEPGGKTIIWAAPAR